MSASASASGELASGTLTSTPISVPVRLAVEKMPYADAVRFLEMAISVIDGASFFP